MTTTNTKTFLNELDAELDGSSICQLRKLRARSSFKGPDFDAVVMGTMRQGLVALCEHDYPAGLEPQERAEMVTDSGRVFNAIMLRD